MVKRRGKAQSGFTMIEIVVTIAVLGALIIVLIVSQHETTTFDRKNKLDLFTHPDKSAVLVRFRHDVIDCGSIVPSFGGYTTTEKSAVLQKFDPETHKPTFVVWDFREPHTANRVELATDSTILSDWKANEVPDYVLSTYDTGSSVGLRLRAFDESGKPVIDEIVVPRV